MRKIISHLLANVDWNEWMDIFRFMNSFNRLGYAGFNMTTIRHAKIRNYRRGRKGNALR